MLCCIVLAVVLALRSGLTAHMNLPQDMGKAPVQSDKKMACVTITLGRPVSMHA